MKKLFSAIAIAVGLMFAAGAQALDVGVAYAPSLSGKGNVAGETRLSVSGSQAVAGKVFVEGRETQTQAKATNAITNEVEANVGYDFGQCYVKAGVGESFGAVNHGFYGVATGGKYAVTDTVKVGLDVEHRHAFTRGRGNYTLAQVGATVKLSDTLNAGVAYATTYGDKQVHGVLVSVNKAF